MLEVWRRILSHKWNLRNSNCIEKNWFGGFNKKLISLDYLLTLVHSDDLINLIKPVNLVFENANEIILDENAIRHILNGRSVKMNKKKNVKEKKFTLAKFKNEIIAIGYMENDNFYPKRLLNVL